MHMVHVPIFQLVLGIIQALVGVLLLLIVLRWPRLKGWGIRAFLAVFLIITAYLQLGYAPFGVIYLSYLLQGIIILYGLLLVVSSGRMKDFWR